MVFVFIVTGHAASSARSFMLSQKVSFLTLWGSDPVQSPVTKCPHLVLNCRQAWISALLSHDSTYAWCVKRDAWSVMRDAYCTTPHVRQKVMRDASKLFLLKEPPSADLLGHFLHTGTWHLIYLNINVSTSIASAILFQMFPIRMMSLYSFEEVLYSAGCSSTRLINFSRYVL